MDSESPGPFEDNNLQAEHTKTQLLRAGVDINRLSSALLAHFRNSEGKYGEMNSVAFSAVMESACPEYVGQSVAIFDTINTGASGSICFSEMFRALVSGPLLDGKFTHAKWTAARYGCQNPVVDEDHQELFDLVNLIIDAVKACNVAKVRRCSL